MNPSRPVLASAHPPGPRSTTTNSAHLSVCLFWTLTSLALASNGSALTTARADVDGEVCCSFTSPLRAAAPARTGTEATYILPSPVGTYGKVPRVEPN